MSKGADAMLLHRRSPMMSRRMLLGCSAAVLGSQAFAPHAGAQPVIMGQAAKTAFMDLSRLLIAHRLDPVIGGRIAAGLNADKPPLSKQVEGLLQLARSKNATQVEDFFSFADEAAQSAALRIISAWYLGVCDNVPGATVIAYELALMFQPTSDVMTIPTYSISGPNGWGSDTRPLATMPSF